MPGDVSRACSVGSRQPPRQRASSVARPLASAPARALSSPGSRRAQASTRPASTSSARRVPAPRSGWASPCTASSAPGSRSFRSAVPPGPASCSSAVPASSASSVRTRNCCRASWPGFQRPRAPASRRRSACRSITGSAGAASARRCDALAGARASSSNAKSTTSPWPLACAVPSSGADCSPLCRRAGSMSCRRASSCQAGAVAVPVSPVAGAAAAGGAIQRPLASSSPPATCACSVRTLAAPSCQSRSAVSLSSGSWCWSQGPGCRLSRSARSVQPPPPSPVVASGVSSSVPPRCVAGACAQSAPRSTARRRAWASGRACAAQGVMRALAWASGRASAPPTAASGTGAAASCANCGSGGSAGGSVLAAIGVPCSSARACRSVSGPCMPARTARASASSLPGTAAVSAPASASSRVRGWRSVSCRRAW